ncbi:MAG: glycosyltransferase family 39 protein [Candidatus Shapirobacteria bacterium]|jgi:hypothetical protein
MFFKKDKYRTPLILSLIFVLSLSLRTFGISWDNGYHLHPDERFLTMVASTTKLPTNIFEYFNTATSPLNPYNYKEFPLFVYGTFPIFLVKHFANLLNLESYQQIYLVGRVVSAIFDSINVITLYFLSVLIIKRSQRFLASLIYCFLVLPVQLSHFFTVDTFLTTFLLLTFLFLALSVHRRKFLYLFLAGLAYGLAISTKISAILFLPFIIVFHLYFAYRTKKITRLVIITPLFFCLTFVVFRIFQPYAFTGLFSINNNFVSNLKTLNDILNNRAAYYPPEVQYLSKTPIIYPLTTLFLWGFGLPFTLFLLIFSVYFISKIKIKTLILKILDSPTNFTILSLVGWTIFTILYQGIQFTSVSRYFLPIYPTMSLLISLIFSCHPKLVKPFRFIFFLQTLYIVAFLGIYSHPHSRYQASLWIFNNMPSGSNIANEHWDDPLPLEIQNFRFSQYQNANLPLYDPDSDQKWLSIQQTLNQTDYIILSSNRLWGSISPLPNRYPITSKYYQDLFDEKLGFKKLKSFHSYPGYNLPFLKNCYYLGPSNYPYRSSKNSWFTVDTTCQYPGIYLRDDTAEESFTVYDHPQVIIFGKQSNNFIEYN